MVIWTKILFVGLHWIVNQLAIAFPICQRRLRNLSELARIGLTLLRIYININVYFKKALITWSFHENFYNFMLGEQRDLSICFTLPLQYFVRSQFRDLFELYLRIHWWCTYPFSNFLCTKDFICKIRIWKVWNCILVFPLKVMVAAVARENFLSDRPVATFPFLFTVFLPGPAITSPWWAMSSCSFSLHTTSNL